MPSDPVVSDVAGVVERLLDEAVRAGASDLHLDPTAAGYQVRSRLDGLLQEGKPLDASVGRACVTRLMVLAQLLTYRLDVPQEGRIRHDGHELRLSVMPTTHGLRAVVRLPAELSQPRTLDQLYLGEHVLAGLREFAASDTGMLLLTGPAGSGKTTTIYALLSHIVAMQPGLSIIAIEDPVERDLPGVTQIEVTPHGRLTYDKALRSVLRQDPQVLMLGEIRDRETASMAVQAALSGHRLLATLHAGSPAMAIARLIEMQIEPYQITSALWGVVSQRLLRRREGDGYRGRLPAAELAQMTPPLRKAALQAADADQLQQILESQPGYITLQAAARRLVDQGLTDEVELSRVIGPPRAGGC